MRLRLWLFLVLAAILAGCASTHPTRKAATYRVGSPYQVAGKWYYPREQPNYDEVGTASWYGPGFNGRRTADGEIYDQRSLTAAHATLPLPVNVRVTNLDNNRSIVLRVNDRGPFHSGRIIDVSERAAELLGFKQAGTARVRVEYLGRATGEPYTMIASSKPQPKEPPPSSRPSSTASGTVMASMAPIPNPPAPIVSSKDLSTVASNPPQMRGSIAERVAQAEVPASANFDSSPAPGDLPGDADFADAPAPAPPAAEFYGRRGACADRFHLHCFMCKSAHSPTPIMRCWCMIRFSVSAKCQFRLRSLMGKPSTGSDWALWTAPAKPHESRRN